MFLTSEHPQYLIGPLDKDHVQGGNGAPGRLYLESLSKENRMQRAATASHTAHNEFTRNRIGQFNMKCLSPMLLWRVAVLATAVIPVASQTPPEQTPSFELISIKPTPANWRGGRFTAMNGAHQFVARNYTVSRS